MDLPYGLLAFVLPLVVGVGLVVLAAFVVRHGRAQRHNLLFAGLYLVSGVKSLSEGLFQVADQFHVTAPLFPDGIAWFHVSQACAFLYTPLLLWFIFSFPRPAGWMARRPWLGLLFVWPSIVVAGFLWFPPSGPLRDLATQAFNVFGTGATVLAVVRLALLRARSQEKSERSQAGIMLLGFLPAFVFGWVLTILLDFQQTATVVAWELRILLYFSPALEIVAACVVAYAILKYALLGVELKAKVGVKSLIMGALLATTFVVTGYIENIVFQGQIFSFAGPYGSFILAGIAGAVVFKPVEILGQKVSTRLFPQAANPSPAYQQQRTEEIYRAQVVYVLRDAQVSDREWQFLRNLRDQLGLKEAAARRIEEEVERSLRVDDPRMGRSAVGTGRSPAPAAAPLGEVEVKRASPLPGAPAVPLAPARATPVSPRPAPRPSAPAFPPASTVAKKPGPPAKPGVAKAPAKTPTKASNSKAPPR